MGRKPLQPERRIGNASKRRKQGEPLPEEWFGKKDIGVNPRKLAKITPDGGKTIQWKEKKARVNNPTYIRKREPGGKKRCSRPGRVLCPVGAKKLR